MSDRVRNVLLGVAAGVVPLLLLDLARILTEAVRNDPGATSRWWVVACYLAAGLVAGVGVAAGRRDRTIPGVGLAVVLLLVLPVLPVADGLPRLPLSPDHLGGEAVALALLGAYAYATVRGPGR